MAVLFFENHNTNIKNLECRCNKTPLSNWVLWKYCNHLKRYLNNNSHRNFISATFIQVCKYSGVESVYKRKTLPTLILIPTHVLSQHKYINLITLWDQLLISAMLISFCNLYWRFAPITLDNIIDATIIGPLQTFELSRK